MVKDEQVANQQLIAIDCLKLIARVISEFYAIGQITSTPFWGCQKHFSNWLVRLDSGCSGWGPSPEQDHRKTPYSGYLRIYAGGKHAMG